MASEMRSPQELLRKLEELTLRLQEAEETLEAIRSGGVDALVVVTPQGDEQLFTLEGADSVYRVFLESIAEGAITLNDDGTILYANSAANSLLFAHDERVVGRRFRDSVRRDNRERFDAFFSAARGGPQNAELRLRGMRGGRPVYLSMRPMPQLAERAMVGVLMDLTDQKKAEKALEAERLARSILEQTSESIVVCDTRGRIIRASKSVASLAGCDPLFRRFDDALPLRTPQGERWSLSRTLSGAQTVHLREAQLERANGIVYYLVVNVDPLRTTEDGFIGAVVTLTDVTPLRQAEEAVRESEERYRAIVETAGEGIAIADLDGAYTFVNQRFAEMLGYRIDEIIGRYSRDLVSDDWNLTTHPTRAALGPGRVKSGELKYRCKDGSALWTHCNVTPIFGTGGAHIANLSLHTDVTERKRAEEAARESAEIAQVLLEVAATLRQSLSLHAVLERLCALVLKAGGHSRVAISLWNEKCCCVEMRASAGERPIALGTRAGLGELSEPVRRAIAEQESVLIDYDASTTGEARGDDPPRSQCVLNVPLYFRERFVGLLVTDDAGERREFTQRQIETVEGIASHAAAAIANATRYEAQRDVAETLQQALMHSPPTVEGLEFGIVSLTASEPALVGGDFWDVFELPDGKVLIVIGDVAGKGVRAAALTETVHTSMRAFALVDDNPGFILRKTNHLLLADPDLETHVTVLAIVLDKRTGTARVASAGHPGPVQVANGNCQLVEPAYGLPLGSFQAEYLTSQMQLQPGQALVLYTDGVSEARTGGSLFGEERVMATVSTLGESPAQDIADCLASAAATFGGELRDDLEVLVMRLT